MPIGLSHGGSNMYTSAKPSNEVLVGTKNGVAIVERRVEGSWAMAHHALAGLHISSIIVEPASGMIFAGAFFDRIYASADGGRTWERRDTGLTVDDVYSLASVQNGDGSRLFAGTQPAHLFYSDDLGHHWRELPAMRDVRSVDAWSFPAPPHVAHTKFITFDPVDSSTIYACIEQGALLKSTDQGQTWREINTVGVLSDHDRPVEHFYDVHKAVIDPRDRQRIYVTGGAGLYVTPDGGGRWNRWMSPEWAPDVYPDGLVLNPRRPDVLFVAAAEHNPATWRQSRYAGGKIFRSADGGRSWQRLRNGLPDQTRHEIGALCLEDWGEFCSVFAATTGGDVYASDDDGDHWSLIASGLAAVSKKGHDQLVAVA